MTTAAPARVSSAESLSREVQARLNLARRVASVTALDRAALERWVIERLGSTIAHAVTDSPFYRDRVDTLCVEYAMHALPGSISALPFTTRQDLAQASPLGMLAVPREELVRLDESSGTGDGRPIAAFFTSDDWVVNNLTVAHHLASVADSGDVVAIAVPYELAGVGQDLDRAFELLGCTIVPLGAASPACSPERMVRAIQRSAASILVCSGTRALYLGEAARRLGLDPRADLGIRRILMAGEGASAAKRRLLARMWDATTYSMFGMTETNTLAMFCTEGELHLVETRNYFEVVDPVTGAAVTDGDVGELAVTTLASRAMPLLRYRTGDRCQIESAPCPCGSVLKRLRHRGRLGDRIEVGQRTTYQLEIEDLVLGSLRQPPYYFAFTTDGASLAIALPEVSLDDAVTTGAILQAVEERLGVPCSLHELDVAAFEESLRTSAKPTMRNFSDLHRTDR